jgi:hypothetical protein
MLKTTLRLLAYAAVLIVVTACDTQFSAMPNPVVIKDGVYWFPLGGRLFAVPEKYVTRYGRNSTDGSLHAFSLHALLPDFEGKTPENKARFGGRGWGDRIEIRIRASDSVLSLNEIYSHQKERSGMEIMSEIPHVEKSTDSSDNFFLIDNGKVIKSVYCDKGSSHNACQNLALHYKDNIYVWIVYSRAYEQDWIKIHDQVIVFLESFERPLDAFPTHP